MCLFPYLRVRNHEVFFSLRQSNSQLKVFPLRLKIQLSATVREGLGFCTLPGKSRFTDVNQGTKSPQRQITWGRDRSGGTAPKLKMLPPDGCALRCDRGPPSVSGAQVQR